MTGLHTSVPPVPCRPRVKGHLQVEVIPPGKVFLLAENVQHVIEDEAAVGVVPLLDGRRTLEEISQAVADRVPFVHVVSIVDHLHRSGYVGEGVDGADPAQVAYWDATGADPEAAATRVATGRVAVLQVGGAPGGTVREALAVSGVQPADGPNDLTAVVTDDYLRPELEEVNRRQLETRQPWILGKLCGTHLWLGPLIRPGHTGCWCCLRHRLEGNRQVERYLRTRHGRAVTLMTALPTLPSSLRLACDLLAHEVVTILGSGGVSHLDGVLVTLDLGTLETQRHVLIRRPQCPACGSSEVALRQPAAPPLHLTARPKTFTADGGHRSCPPEETLRRLEKHVSPILGAVSSVVEQSSADDGLAYSFSSGHNFAVVSDSLRSLQRNLRGRSGGKGRTQVQARVSAICEAIERYCGVFCGDEPRIRERYSAIAGEAVHPGALLLFSARQYRERGSWNAQCLSPFHIVPEPFDVDRCIDWTPAWSLTDRRVRMVPTAYCYFGHPDTGDHFFCASDANGNAAGNNLEEAILQGLLELVERDSVAVWWYNRLRRPAVEIDSFDEPYFRALTEHYRSLGRGLWLLDLTTDIGIPAVAAVSPRLERTVQDLLLGFGAHLDPRMAAMRAVTELNQFLPAVGQRNPDGTTRYWFDEPEALRWWQTATLRSEAYLVPDEAALSRRWTPADSLAGDDLAADVDLCVRRLDAAGLEVIVLDQTRSDIELNVVKVMVPGLRHFWRRLGPGRLFDVPVRMGWLPRATAESDLNPTSIFF